ncbi:hypothetical protein [Treponema primitia]|uniref:hypothetical protein n=1 Tax=Treponema primitia TaxID=88058 RepID=UPI00025551AB|nr:hypothetical protein [Treponema primitia]
MINSKSDKKGSGKFRRNLPGVSAAPKLHIWALGFALLLAGCAVPVSAPVGAPQGAPAGGGLGTVRVEVSGLGLVSGSEPMPVPVSGVSATPKLQAVQADPKGPLGPQRTVYPTPPDTSKLKYTYIWTDITDEVEPKLVTPDQDSDGNFILAVGSYTLDVQAYINGIAEPANLVGTGVGTKLSGDGTPTITVGDSENLTVKVALEPLDGTDPGAGTGTGTLAYTISYPATTEDFTLTLRNLGDETTPPLSDANDDDNLQTYDGTETVAAGYYDLTVQLKDATGRTAGKNDVVHVYQNMTTTIPAADWTFTDADFRARLVEAAAVTGLAAPVTGKPPAAAGSLSVPDDANYGFAASAGFTWEEQTTDGWTTFSGGKFAPRATYRAVITLKANSGYKFSGSIIATVNEGPLDGWIVSAGKISGDTAMNTLTFTVTFPATDSTAKLEPTTWKIPAPHTLTITSTSATTPLIVKPTGELTLSLTGDTGDYTDIRWTVNGNPVTADAPAGTAYTFKGDGRSLGTYTVGVRAQQDGLWYENRVKVPVTNVELVLEGDYTGGITAIVEDGLLKSITTDAGAILIGRKDDETVTLKLDEAGKLQFRAVDGAGNVPIGSYGEFQLINTQLGDSHSGDKYKQEADLDLMGNYDPDTGAWSGQQWTAVGNDSARFTGTFDGNGKAISNLYINNRSILQGLFGIISTGTVKNVHIASGSVTGADYTGGVAGYNQGIITACSNSSKVTGRNATGGVAGMNNGGTIFACYNTGAVSGNYYVGGVVGDNYPNGIINACYNTGRVSGYGTSGGVVGYNLGGTILYCFWANFDGNGVGDSIVGSVYGSPVYGGTGSGGTAKFGAAWPSTSNQWTIGANAWKNLGNWNGGTNPVYPTLWWE